MPIPHATQFVLDCSVVFAWYFSDESNPYADQVLQTVASAHILVPAIWHLEIANTLVVGERRRRSKPDQATAFLSFLTRLPIQTDRHTSQRAWGATLSLARAHGLSAYDAAYLDLAARESLPLATLDDHLAAAAGLSGVSRFAP